MKKVYRLGLGRSKTGKILDRTTTWHNGFDSLLKHIDENPDDKDKPLFVSIDGGAYEPTTIVKEINRN